MVTEYIVKIVYGTLVGIILITGWVTKVQLTQDSHGAEIQEVKQEIRPQISELNKSVNYIKGWVEAQPQPKRRRD